MTHTHRGKSSERFLEKESIIDALNILSGQTILDAGCGNGYMAKEFSKRVGTTGKVVALDPDERAIDLIASETKGTNIEPIAGDITQKTKFEDFSIDLIYLSTVIHGFSEFQLNGFLEEMKRLLKPGGRLAVVEIKKEQTPFGPPINIRFSPEELNQTIGLKPVALVEPGKHFYMCVFENNME